MMIFETNRLLVRTYNENDKENFFLLNGSEEVMRYIRPVKTREECDAFLLEVTAYSEAEKLYGRWAVEDKLTKAFVGSFAIIPVEGKEQMQLGYALLKEHWRKGYATELTVAGLHYVFTKTPLDPIYAYTEGPNISSQKVLLKAGFKPNGSYNEKGKEIVGFVLGRAEYLGRDL
jgi:RimJ/RimL family protein N-acetyltransferase